MSRFIIEPTPLSGLLLLKREKRVDERGFFSRLFCADELATAGWTRPVLQINNTLTRERNSIRGLHFQHPPNAETKIVSCLRGEIFDIALDLRTGSPTFLKWHGQRLSAENGCSLLIPPGFAHGFQALSPDCELVYLHDALYAPESEGGVHPLDPRIAIDWPLPVGSMSDRDQKRPFLASGFQGIQT